MNTTDAPVPPSVPWVVDEDRYTLSIEVPAPRVATVASRAAFVDGFTALIDELYGIARIRVAAHVVSNRRDAVRSTRSTPA